MTTFDVAHQPRAPQTTYRLYSNISINIHDITFPHQSMYWVIPPLLPSTHRVFAGQSSAFSLVTSDLAPTYYIPPSEFLSPPSQLMRNSASRNVAMNIQLYIMFPLHSLLLNYMCIIPLHSLANTRKRGLYQYLTSVIFHWFTVTNCKYVTVWGAQGWASGWCSCCTA